MVNAGDLNKADGDVLYAADISKLIDMKAKQFKQTSQMIYNTAYTGFDAKTNVKLDNIKYDVFNTDTATTKTNFTYDATDDLYKTFVEVADLTYYDDWTDGSYNSSIWTASPGLGASTAITSGDLRISQGTNTDGATSSLKTVTNIFSLSNYYRFRMRWGKGANTAHNHTFTLRITDGTNHSNIVTVTTNGNGYSLDETYELKKINSTTVQWKTLSGSSWTNINIASFSANIKLEVIMTCANYQDSAYIGFNFVKYDSGTAATLIFQTTSLPTIKDCIPTWNSTIDGDNTLDVSISADGTDYETVTDATYKKFTNTGTNLFVKFVVTRADTAAIDKINSYSVWYNCGVTP